MTQVTAYGQQSANICASIVIARLRRLAACTAVTDLVYSFVMLLFVCFLLVFFLFSWCVLCLILLLSLYICENKIKTKQKFDIMAADSFVSTCQASMNHQGVRQSRTHEWPRDAPFARLCLLVGRHHGVQHTCLPRRAHRLHLLFI